MTDSVTSSAPEILGKYKTFVFTGEGSEMKVKPVGVQELLESKKVSEKICGQVHIWGYYVPIVRPLGVQPTQDCCMVLFEYKKPFQHYMGLLVQDEQRVINIAENRA